MQKLILIFLTTLLIPLLNSGLSFAGSLAKSPKSSISVSIFGHFGASSYSFDDINSILISQNNWMGGDYFKPIDSGTEAGGRIILQVTPHFSIAPAVTAMDAESNYDGDKLGTSAHIYEIMIVGMLHPEKKMNFGAGLSVGLIFSDGEVKGYHWSEVYYQNSFSGRSTMMSGFGVMELKAISGAWIRLEAGIRKADISEVSWSNGYRFTNADGSDLSISYNGLFMRAGVRLSGDFLN